MFLQKHICFVALFNNSLNNKNLFFLEFILLNWKIIIQKVLLILVKYTIKTLKHAGENYIGNRINSFILHY